MIVSPRIPTKWLTFFGIGKGNPKCQEWDAAPDRFTRFLTLFVPLLTAHPFGPAAAITVRSTSSLASPIARA